MEKNIKQVFFNFKKKYFDKWPFYWMILLIMLPVVLQSLIETLINFVDNIAAGQIETASQAAVSGIGIGNQIFFVFFLTMIGVASGFGVYTSQFFGAQKQKQLQEIVRMKIVVALILGLVFASVIQFFTEPLVSFLAGGEGDGAQIDRIQTINSGVLYLRYVSISYPFAAVSIALSFTFQQTHRIWWPITVTLFSLVINIVLDFALVLSRIPGINPIILIAIGTIVARVFEIVVFTIILVIKKYEFSHRLWQIWKIDSKLWLRALVAAGPFIFNELVWSLAITARFVFYAERGLDTLTGLIISSTISDLAFVIFSGIAISASILIGFSLGENKLKKAEDIARKLLVFSFVIAFFTALVIVSAAFWVPLAFFPRNTLTANITATWFTVSLAVAFPFITLVATMQFIIKAGGDSFSVFITDGFLQWVGPTLISFLLVTLTSINIVIINVIFEALVGVKLFVAWLFYRRKKWLKNLAKDNERLKPI